MKKRVLSAMLALIMLMTMVVSMPVKAEAYELTVNNIHWGTGDSEKILSWDPVEGATRYEVSCGSGGGNAENNTSKDLAFTITQSGTYTPTVTAYNGDVQITEETTGPSKDFVLTPLDTPTNVVVDFDNGTITWNPVANAVEYYVALYRYDESHGYSCAYNYEGHLYSSTPSIALSNFTSRFVDGQEYYFGIRAYDRTYYYGNSDYGHSEKFTYTAPVLPTVQNIQWGTGENEKVLTWDAVEGATRYYVSCGSGGGNDNTTSANLAYTIKQSGTYTPTVTAYKGDIQLTKETAGPSKDFVLTPLDTPTNVVADVDSGTVTWNDVPNATEYYVALYGYNDSYGYDCRSCYETSVYSATPNAAMSSFASRLTEGQEYYFGIRAYDDTYNYGYSDFGHSVKFTYETKYDVTTSVFGEGGTVSPSQRIAKGGDVTITLTPDTGYVISYLQVNGVDVTSAIVDNTYTISDVQGNITVVAQFSRCRHEWGSGTVTKEATCKEAGTREYTCPICYDTKQETIAKLTTHTWDGGVVTTAPTCKDTGIMTYTCTVCKMTRTEIIGATGVHTYGAYTTTTEPTCIATGIEARYCSICNAKDERSIPATGIHANTEVKNAKGATYTATGYTGDTVCKDCGKVITAGEVIPKLTPTAPAVPELSISKADGKITISWNAVSGATKYWIYRSTDGTNFKYYDTTTKTSYTNSSVTSGTRYYYKVKAVATINGTDYASSYSAAKNTIPLTTPTLSISKSDGKIKLSWGAVTGATKYWIYRSTDGKNFKYYDSTTKTTYTNSSVTSGTKYYYKIKAVKTVNGTDWASSYSAAKSTVPMTTPTLSATLSSGKIKLSWGAVTGATKYWVYRSTDGKNFSYYDSTTKTSYTNSSVTAGKTYYYKIKAVKTVSSTDWASDYSNVVSKKP